MLLYIDNKRPPYRLTGVQFDHFFREDGGVDTGFMIDLLEPFKRSLIEWDEMELQIHDTIQALEITLVDSENNQSQTLYAKWQ